jgi:hypothetical protein
MAQESNTTSVEEAISVRVGKFLLDNGFGLANHSDMALKKLKENKSIGIFLKKPEQPAKNFREKLFKTVLKPRRIVLGRIWFKNELRGALETNWVFEVCGRENLEVAEVLADKLSVEFGSFIKTKLIQEEPEFEKFSPGVKP